jgi:flagellar biosynthesis anti-sigma factor FlgM
MVELQAKSGRKIMRVNLNQAAQTVAESNNANSAARNNQTSTDSVLGGTLGEDQAQLSGVHVQVQALAAQAAQLPEVRQGRVNALRQVVSEGNYHPSSDEVAQAMFDNMLVEPAA